MSYKMPLASTTNVGSMEVGSGLSVTNGIVSATLNLNILTQRIL